MNKTEVKEYLDHIREMSDDEITINKEFIRKVAENALALIKNLERKKK